jgi:tetratricopeptide (TPR) repeat protein
MKTSTGIILWLILILLFLVQGCKQDEGETIAAASDPISDPVRLTSLGWKSFEGKKYSEAISLFEQALDNDNLYCDAYNGLGWAYGRLDSLKKSEINFDIAIGLEKNGIDAYAGRSFVCLARAEYQKAIQVVSVVQQSQTSFYVFRHDVNISLDDLLLVKAQSHFMLGDYNAAQELINQLDPQNPLDPLKPTYIEDLALEIENLWKTI